MSASAELVYTGPFLPPNQQCQSSEGKSEYVLCVTYKKEKGFIACLLLFCLSLSVFVCLSLSFSLSVLVVIFTGLASFIGSKDDESGDVNWSCQTCLQSNRHHQQTQLFTGRMPFLSVNQHFLGIEGKSITFHDLAHPKLTLLPWGVLPCLSSAV